MKTRRALVASYDVPRDDRDSGGRRLHDLTMFLHESGWTIDFVAANGLGDPRHARILQKQGIAVHDDSPARHADVAQPSPPLFERLVSAGDFDLAMLAFWPVAELYLPVLRRLSPRTRVIVDSLDLHFLRDARRILLGHATGAASPLLDADFGEQLVGELNAYAAADAVMTVSEKEACFLRDFMGDAAPAAVIPDGEDMAPAPLPMAERQGMLLLGSYQHLPNVDALEHFCREVLPRVDGSLLARHPVYVVGTGLTESVCRITDGIEHVRLVGWAPSIVPYFHRARISVIPLRYGAGTKRKMIQALMTGTPTVSTRVGMEGLDLKDGEHVLEANDPAAFARSIERLLRDEALWARLASSGRARITQTHGRGAVRARFGDFVETVLARPAKAALLAEGARERYAGRINYHYHQQINVAACKLVAAAAPADGIVLVASGGSRELLKLGERTAWHFPRREDGQFRSDGFADGQAAVNHLEALRAQGVQTMLLPGSAFWMLDHYPEFKQHLESRYRLAGHEDGVCRLYDLRNGASPHRQHLSPSESAAEEAVRLIAFYLPQFHPIPENDRWWGEGFTEWRNVVKAQPLFPGHHQPQLSADLGFYDLRLRETREDQARLARQYGIHGFCWYHYWFNGKRLLQRPFDEVLRSGRPDLPFCLCWANEPWSRRWDGSEADLLQPQAYSPADDVIHIRWLLGALADPRAIKIDDKPVFLVYRADQLPEPARTVDRWRREVARAGLKGLYLMAVETGWDGGWDATQAGFDAKVLFQPQFSLLNTVARQDVPNPRLRVYDYQQAWPVLANPSPVSYLRYDTVFPSWDNTARQGERGWVVHNSTPQAYERWLRLAIERAGQRPKEQRIVFLNAWNEWAEGCHLEPDRKDGLAYLEATQRGLGALPVCSPPSGHALA